MYCLHLHKTNNDIYTERGLHGVFGGHPLLALQVIVIIVYVCTLGAANIQKLGVALDPCSLNLATIHAGKKG